MEWQKKQNAAGEKAAGVLMSVASLPGPDGIGSFGKEAYRFVDLLAEMGIRVWQILPLNPLGYGNSPYQPFSSYAGEPLYIDLGLLEQAGYLSSDRPAYVHRGEVGRIDYAAAKDYREPWLRKAYAAFREKSWEDPDFLAFREMSWVYPYAVFIALKQQNGMVCWNTWPREQQDWILDGAYDISHLEDEIGYQMFLQYQFYTQWMALKAYANGKDIRIMGDVPFYVGLDSLDVWSSREDFLLDENWRPSFVAGVPPDYFSVTGQRWGNPIYNWEAIRRKGFSFWIDRLDYSAKLYDIIRIDHFRAFDTYWKIVASCETAVDGQWVQAPGYDFFEELYRRLPDIQIVAEDLGDNMEGALRMRDHFDLMGMVIAEFALFTPEAYKPHQLVYTGTHDNQTVAGWYASQTPSQQRRIRRRLSALGKSGERVYRKMVRFVYGTSAELAVVPVADLLGLGDEARLNFPGTVGSPNWEWRLTDWKKLRRNAGFVRRVITESGRGETML